MISLSILDYSIVDEASSPKQALQETAELAILADRIGYKRFWVPEQHYAYSIASSNPEMLMMYLAAKTKRIRIGSGGVMIPHYSPYKVAESFRMLEALYPGRIDLGIGNSPGGRLTNLALNEEKGERMSYDQEVSDIIKYLTDDYVTPHRFQKLAATPVIDTVPEIWVLGAGGRSTEIAAMNGTSYIYAHLFRPSPKGIESIKEYKKNFQPSTFQKRPNVGVAVFVNIAETYEKAKELERAFELWLTWIESAKNPLSFPSIETAKNYQFNSFEERKIEQIKKREITGDPEQVKEGILKLANRYGADEVVVVLNIPGIENRKKGIQLLAECFRLNGDQ